MENVQCARKTYSALISQNAKKVIRKMVTKIQSIQEEKKETEKSNRPMLDACQLWTALKRLDSHNRIQYSFTLRVKFCTHKNSQRFIQSLNAVCVATFLSIL